LAIFETKENLHKTLARQTLPPRIRGGSSP